MAYLILSRVKRDLRYSSIVFGMKLNWNTYEVNSSSVPGRLSPVVLLLFTRLIICGTFKTIHKTIVEMLAKPSDKEYKSVIFRKWRGGRYSSTDLIEVQQKTDWFLKKYCD